MFWRFVLFCFVFCIIDCLVAESLVTAWTIACRAPLSIEFPRQKYRSGYFDTLAILTSLSWLIHQSLPSSHCVFSVESSLTTSFNIFSKFMSPRFHVLHHFLKKSVSLIVTDVYKLLGITSLFFTFIIILDNFHICVKDLCKTLSSQCLSLLFPWIITFTSFVLVLPQLLYASLDQIWKHLAFRAEMEHLSMMKVPIFPII